MISNSVHPAIHPKGTTILPPWSCFLGYWFLSCLLRNKSQKEPLALPPFLPKRFRQRILLQEGNLRMLPAQNVRQALLARYPMSHCFGQVCSPLSQVPVNRPFSRLKSNTHPPLLSFVQRCHMYPMLPLCLWNFHAYVHFPCTCIKILIFLLLICLC